MIFDFDPWELGIKGVCIIFLITFSLLPLHILADFITDANTICDSEKQSKFILECMKADTTKDLRAIGTCEQMSLRLYCK